MLLSLYCLIPPLRAEVKTLKFSNEGHLPSYERKGNLILFEDNDIFLELHEIKKRHGYIKLGPLPDDLKKIIKQSYDVYPRENVFTNLNKYTTNAYDILTKPASVGMRLKNLFDGFDVGSSMLRSSYVTFMYSKRPRINFNMKKWMALNMRTSITMLESAYHKILDEPPQPEQQPVAKKHKSVRAEGIPDNVDDRYDDDEDENDCVVMINRRTNQKNARNPNVKDSYKRHLEAQKKYYKKNKANILVKQKRRRDANPQNEAKRKVLYNLNNDENYSQHVRQSTLDKYDIKQLDDGRYV